MKNVFEQFDNNKNVKEIEKSEIFAALKTYNNPMMFKKTGKELKEHITNVLLPILIEENNTKLAAISTYLESVSVKPTHDVYCEISLGKEFPFKIYSWEESHYREKSVEGSIFKGFGDVECCDEAECCPNYCSTQEEANNRCLYNSWVEELRNIILDIRTANVLINNLEDEQEYWLNLEQVTSLKF